MIKDKNWIQGAIKRPGAFTKKAEERGISVKELAAKVTANPDEYARIVNHPILYKYEDFVNATKAIYGHIKI